MSPPKENVSLLFKLYCLTVMTLVAATYAVALRYTRTVEAELYFSTTAVCITEVIKLFLSVGILAKETGSLTRLITSLKENVFGSHKELLKLSVPSLVYALQNNMAFVALSNLDAAVYQVTYQLKIPCTALCTVLMLNRSLTKLQWFSVFMLCGGVTLVQWNPAQATKVQVEQNALVGFGAIAVAVLCSGFAGVYFEKVLKSSDTSLWVRNIQMYLSGIVVTLFGVYMSDRAQVLEKGFFYGYTYYVWFVIWLFRCWKAALRPPHSLVQAEQPQLSLTEVLQPSDHLCASPLDLQQQLRVLLELGTPDLDTVLQGGSDEDGLEGDLTE
ncbi:CMP-sialic acid transporter isoform X2 [Heliangelus exortis]|uniref:CMP-sialic acid transporter isoform X2 n=1 Tax=Heliangelus exortis TaxID=472823 RepID=UPI003A8D5E95